MASRPVRTWLIIETILGLPAIAAGALMALMAPMMFDAPGPDANPATWMLFWSVLSFPPVTLLALVLAWIAIARRRDRGALWFSLLPLLPVAAAIIAVMWLQVASNGQFAS